MKILNLLALSLLLAVAAAAQTLVYTVPSGTACSTSISGCTLHDLTTTDQTITPWGWFVGGVYYTQFDFQLFKGQNAAAGATYCDGNGVYVQIPRPDLGPTAVEWTLDCYSNQWTNGSGPGEVSSGPYHIVVDLITHWYKVTKLVYRWYETFTIWDVDQGTVTLTPVAQ